MGKFTQPFLRMPDHPFLVFSMMNSMSKETFPVPQRVSSFFEEIKNIPFLKNHADKADTFLDLPIIDKQGLRAMVEANFNLHEEETGVFFSRTGGTLSESLMIPLDPAENKRQRQILADHLAKENILTPKTVAVNLFNYKHLYRSASVLDDVIDFAGATSIGIGAVTPDEFVVNFIRTFKADMIVGTPSRIFQLATYTAENNIDLKIPNIMFGGEVMSAQHQEAITKTFHVANIYGLYGLVEIGIPAYSRYSVDGPVYKMIPELAYAEIDNPDEDGFGPLVLTNVLKKRFPVLRYKCADIGKVIHKNGEEYFELRGRGQHVFRVNGQFYSEADFKTLVSDTLQYQIHLSYTAQKRTKITVFLVQPGVTDPESFLRTKLHELHSILNTDLSLLETEIKLVDPSELKTNLITTKTPLVIDARLSN